MPQFSYNDAGAENISAHETAPAARKPTPREHTEINYLN
jgi:hypothetical protein